MELKPMPFEEATAKQKDFLLTLLYRRSPKITASSKMPEIYQVIKELTGHEVTWESLTKREASNILKVLIPET